MATKFSEFASGGTIGVGAKIAGLDASVSPDNRIFDFPGLGILDSNGSALLGWSQPISGTAVNYLEFQNALSGNPAVISALGGDVDVGLYLTTQGDGSISLVPGPNGFVVAAGTTAIGMPSGTTAQRPTIVNGGYMRYNSENFNMEYYNSDILDWVALATGTSVLSVTSADVNKITIGGTINNPTVDIASTYAGQTSITTLGTIGAGTWNASTIDVAHGGTGDTSFTAYSVICGGTTSTSALQSVASVGTAGQVLTSAGAGALPIWSTPTTGTVTSVSGTANRITSTGGAAPVIDIDSTYVGQTSITTLGTVATGTWSATIIDGAHGGTGVANTGKTITLGGNLTTSGAFSSTFTMTNNTSVTFPVSGTLATTAQAPSALPVPLAEGGTNANLTASNGGIFYSTATAGAILSGTATAGQMLRSGSTAAPTWSATVWPNTTTANRLLYSSATNTISEIASTNGSILITNFAGVPSWAGSMTNGQLVIGNTGGTPIKGNLTPANGVQVTNGAASITIGLPNSVPGRNLLYNGGFNVWQRGTSFVPTTYLYGPDRWQCGSGAATCGFIQVYDAITNSYLIRIQRNNGSSSVADVNIATSLTNNMSVKVRNNVLTLSFVASTGAGFSGSGGAMKIFVVTGETFGSDASFLTTGWTNQANILATTQVVNSTPTRYTFTTSTASANTTQVGVRLGFTPTGTAGAADYLQISEVQLEVSPSATNFEVVPYPQELQRCQYFYQIIKGGCGYATASNSAQIGVEFFQTLRAAPSIVSATGVIAFTDGIANYTQSSVSITSYLTEAGGLIQLNNFTGLTTNRPGALNTSLNGNGITIDSELY